MPVLYHSVERGDPRFPATPKKNYASAKARGTITPEELAKKIASTSSMSVGDVYGVLMQERSQIVELLGEGFTVDNGIGTYYLTLDAEGQTTPQEVINSTIKGNRLNFRPSKELGNGLKGIAYEKGQ